MERLLKDLLPSPTEEGKKKFTLGIVASINRTHQELDDPHAWVKIDTALPHHLCLLRLEVGSTVHETTDDRVVIELFKEFLGLEIVTDLSEFY